MKKTVFVACMLLFTSLAWAQETFKSLNDKGNKALQDEDYQTALDCFKKALALENNDKSSVSWTAAVAGICAEELKNYSDALKLYAQAIENESTDQDIYDRQLKIAKKKDPKVYEETLLLGRKNIPALKSKFTSKLLYHYFNSKQYAKTITTADQYLALKPNHYKTRYLKAVAYARSGNSANAIALLQTLVVEQPTNHKTAEQLGLVMYNQVNQKYEKIRDKYNALKKPTRIDYSDYRKASKNTYPKFEKAIAQLLKAYKLKQTAQTKKALYTAYTRIEKKDLAAKYK